MIPHMPDLGRDDAFTALAHCPDCGLFLRWNEGCLHIPAMPPKCALDASKGDGEGLLPAFSPEVLSNHAERIGTNRKDNPRGR